MKKIFITFLVLTICELAAGQEQYTSSPVVGTWQFVAGSYTTGGIKRSSDSTTIAQFKVITPDWFMFSTYDKTRGNLLGSSAGKITISGNKVTHTAQYSGSTGRIGIPATYTMEVTKNMLHQRGFLGDMEIDEYWVRIY